MPVHPPSRQIVAAIEKCAVMTRGWSGIVYRATSIKYANRQDLLSGEGSRRLGGRWNPPGIHAVYGSLDPRTAMLESLANYEEFGIPASRAMPLVFVGINVRMQAVLDITLRGFLNSAGLTVKDLVQCQWQTAQDVGGEGLTQVIGRLANEAEFEGILVPSARAPSARNIVIFPKRRRKGSSIKIENVRRLPKKTKD